MRTTVDKKIKIGRFARDVQETLGLEEVPSCAYNPEEGWIETDAELTEEQLQEIIALHDTEEKDPYNWPEWKVKLHKIGKQRKQGKRMAASMMSEEDELVKLAVFEWLEMEKGEE